MDVSNVYTLARTLSYTDSTQMPDATLQVFANLAYHDLENTIVSQVNEDFFYNEWFTNTVAWQREYVLPIKSGATAWLKKLLSVSMYKTASDTSYIKLDENRLTNLEYDVNKYSTEQQFYYIADNSVFIYPTPSESVTNGLKLYWVCNLWDIATSGSETSIEIPIEYHDLIALGMLQYIYQSRGMLNEATMALNLYNTKKQQMVWELTDRNAWPHLSELPNLSIYA